MNRIIAAAALAATLALVHRASASDMPNASNGVGLLAICESFEQTTTMRNPVYGDISRSWACLSYVRGVLDDLHNATPAAAKCYPPSVTYGQAIRITLKFLRDNPEALNMPSPLLIRVAMSKAFPCATK